MSIEFARPHRGNVLGTPGGDGDDAKERDTDAEMRHGGAPGRARQSRRTPQRHTERRTQDHSALGNIDERTGHDKDRQSDAKRRQDRTAVLEREGGRDRNRRNNSRCDKTLGRAEKIAAFPSEQRPERHGQQ